MGIVFKDTKYFEAEALQNLFLSVDWSSGHYPDKLVVAMKNSGSVFTAWDGEQLIGLISAMDDGIMNAYIHYLLINPNYQGKGIGKELVQRMKDKYQSYLRIILIAYEKETVFYETSLMFFLLHFKLLGVS